MKILVAGGTGFLGRALVDRLIGAGHSVSVMTRNPSPARTLYDPAVTFVHWDANTAGAWRKAIDGTDGIINLAGESIAARRWSDAQKERISHSRLQSTRVIADAIERSNRKPKVLINASGVGYYGDVKTGDVTEGSPSGSDFFAELCRRWEAEALRARESGVRVVTLRTGVVLHASGGALTKFLLPFKLFVGGPLGDGDQWLAWIHRDDALRAILFALEAADLSGPLNLSAPQPVTMREFCRSLGKALHRPSWMPVPEFALRIALGEMADVVLKGQRAVPKKLLAAGFQFRFPTIDDALSDLLKKS